MMSDIDALLSKHGAQTLLYLLLRALGQSQREAAGYAGFSHATGSNREQEAYWPGAMDAVRARLGEFDPVLLPLLPEAISAYQGALGQSNASAARDVLDRVFGKPGARSAKPDAARELPPLIVLKGIDDTETD
jgi:hypothetical protein